VTARYRWEVAGRFLLAGVGGYGLTALLSTVLALALPALPGVSRAEGVLIASLLSFAFYTLFVLWVFATRSAWRLWSITTGACLLLVGVQALLV
jgi:putative flippase GtrA